MNVKHDERESSISQAYRVANHLGPEEFVAAIEALTANSASSTHVRVVFKLGPDTEESIRDPREAIDRIRELGNAIQGLWIWTEPFSLDVDRESGRANLSANGPTPDEAHIRLSNLRSTLADALTLEEIVDGEMVLFETQWHITEKLYRETVMEALDAISRFDLTARTQFWIHRRDKPTRDPVPLDKAELGEVLIADWQNVGRIDIEIFGAALHAFLEIHTADTWLNADIHVPEDRSREKELIETLSGVLGLVSIPRHHHERKGTATYRIKSFNKTQLLLGLRSVEATLRGDDGSKSDPPEDLLPEVFLSTATFTRQLEKNSDPDVLIPMDILESFSTLDEFHAGLANSKRNLRSVEYSVVGGQERQFNLRVNVTDELMTAWSNVEPADLVRLVARIGDYLSLEAIEGRPGVAKADETPFLSKALEVAKPLLGVFPAIPTALTAVGGTGVVATYIFAMAEVTITHPVADGSVFKVPQPGQIAVIWQRNPPWWRFWAEREGLPATVTMYRYGAPHGESINATKPGWLFEEGPGRYRVDVDINNARPSSIIIEVDDPNAEGLDEEDNGARQ